MPAFGGKSIPHPHPEPFPLPSDNYLIFRTSIAGICTFSRAQTLSHCLK
jgi:hypothetical protein